MVYGDGVEKTTLYLPVDLQRALKDQARRSGRPQAELVREALRSYLAAAAAAPQPASIGLGEDDGLIARESKDWLAGEWSRR